MLYSLQYKNYLFVMTMEKNKKVFYGVIVIILVFTVILGVLWMKKPAQTKTDPVPPTPTEQQLPSKETFPDKFVFETDPQNDTTVVFHLQPGDKTHDVEWRDKTNTVVIWHSDQGNSFQVISFNIQKKWMPMPEGGELIFNNGKKLTVKFVTD